MTLLPLNSVPRPQLLAFCGAGGHPFIHSSASPFSFSASRSFVLSSLGFTAVAFVTGSLALWAPAFLYRSRLANGSLQPCPTEMACSTSDR